MSYLLVGSWQFLSSTYGAMYVRVAHSKGLEEDSSRKGVTDAELHSLFVPDLTPNIGLFWYFFIEMFDHYRTFFLCVFQIFAFVFVLPISVKFRYVCVSCSE